MVATTGVARSSCVASRTSAPGLAITPRASHCNGGSAGQVMSEVLGRRQGYEWVSAGSEHRLYDRIKAMQPALVGERFAGRSIATADDFSYTDPIDGPALDPYDFIPW